MSDHVPHDPAASGGRGDLLTKLIIFGCLLLLIGIPLVVRPEGRVRTAGDDAPRVIILTPHNEQIRAEFREAFIRWHEAQGYGPVRVEYRVPGGTNENRKMLQTQFISALERGRDPGGGADLVFGGGSYEFGVLKRGVSVTVGDEVRAMSILAPPDFSGDEIDLTAIYGSGTIGDAMLVDPDGYWFGTALSGFGIVYNRDALRQIGVPEPREWADLCDPRLMGWIALVNPLQSGSITSAFHAVLEHEGWERSWAILRRMAANARYFPGSALNTTARMEAHHGASCIPGRRRHRDRKRRRGSAASRVAAPLRRDARRRRAERRHARPRRSRPACGNPRRLAARRLGK